MDEVSAGGSAEGIQLSDGDYCNYYKTGDDISREEANNQGGYTGYTPPTPYKSYQESDPYGNVCQADGATWGQEVGTGDPSNNCYNTCGMHHIVSLHELSDHPWASWFGEPSLAVSAEALVHTVTFSGESAYNMAWGYVCPLLKDTTTGHILEYCLEEWRSVHNPPEWKEERIGTCGPNGYDTVVTYFWPGTKLATEQAGSANTLEFSGTPSGWTHYAATITKGDLLNAISLAKEPPTVKNGCGTTFSTELENYALIGVEQGVEGEHKLSGIGGAGRNLQLYDTYTPVPPKVSTSAASNVTQTQATLNGTVNPNGVETHYHFEYGTTTSYGSSTSEGNAGTGTTTEPENAAITGLLAGTTYHYRLVAKNISGTSYGADHELVTALMPRASMVEWQGKIHVYYRGLNGQLREWYWNGTEWSQHYWGNEKEVGGEPSAVVHSNGSIDVYYLNTKGQIGQWWYGTSHFTEWSQHNWGNEGEVVGDPSAVVLPNGTTDVYYRSTKGQLGQWWFGVNQSTEWSQHNWGNENEVTGDPSAVAHSNNNIYVYYRSTKQQLGQWWFGVNQSTEWSQHNWGNENEIAGNPSAVVLPNGTTNIYYRSTKQQLGQWWFGVNQSTEWSQHNWGNENEVTGDPSAVAHSNNNIYVYYRSTKQQLGQWWFGVNQSTEWSQHNWGYEGALGGDPSASALASGGEDIYYGGTNTQMSQWWINGSSWNLTTIGSW